VNYTELIPIIIKGMQEQDQRIQNQKAENKALRDEVTELRKMVQELKYGRSNSGFLTSAFLEQNTPNPVGSTTSIRYFIPETSTSARLDLTNAKGLVVKSMNLNRGTGQLNLNTQALASGTYNYTLYVNGKQADTKRMVIAR
jgi:hypothetical protein